MKQVKKLQPYSSETRSETKQYHVVVLMGIKHCGKSTQGKLLADRLGYHFYDTDDVIKMQTRCTPRELYNTTGKEGFKKAEEDACRYLARKALQGKMVIATGGGICGNEKALNVLKRFGFFIFLDVEEKVAADRIVSEMTIEPSSSIQNIPAYIAKENPHNENDVRAIFHNYFSAREKKYTALAEKTVKMLSVEPEENLKSIIKVLTSSRFL